ncbi:MAG: radical SAM protein, partial [Ignavibacteria bacterium]|nr:radical SAM protein [Ignavibacteria bacterium]
IANYEFKDEKSLSGSRYPETEINPEINSKSEIPNSKLIDVLHELEKLPIERIRISSIEPNLLNNEIISFAKSSDKFCNHFHIPLQSGDNEILKLMRRRYNREYYRELVNKLNEEIKDVGIGVDVIVGFRVRVKSILRILTAFLNPCL